MEKIPSDVSVDNKDNIKNIYKMYLKNQLNQHVYIFLLSRKNENDYFDLDKFAISYVNRNTEYVKELMEDTIKNLEDLGWKCKYSFGDTGLFIYSSDNPPPSCW